MRTKEDIQMEEVLQAFEYSKEDVRFLVRWILREYGVGVHDKAVRELNLDREQRG